MLKGVWLGVSGLLAHTMGLYVIFDMLNQPSTVSALLGVLSALMLITADVILLRGYIKWGSRHVIPD